MMVEGLQSKEKKITSASEIAFGLFLL